MGWFSRKNKEKSTPHLLGNQRLLDKADKKRQEWIETGCTITCPECGGDGKISKIFGGYKAAEVCTRCNGAGELYD